MTPFDFEGCALLYRNSNPDLVSSDPMRMLMPPNMNRARLLEIEDCWRRYGVSIAVRDDVNHAWTFGGMIVFAREHRMTFLEACVTWAAIERDQAHRLKPWRAELRRLGWKA